MQEKEALWIFPSSGVHASWMNFGTDGIGLDKNDHVIRVRHNLVPYRVTSVSLFLASLSNRLQAESQHAISSQATSCELSHRDLGISVLFRRVSDCDRNQSRGAVYHQCLDGPTCKRQVTHLPLKCVKTSYCDGFRRLMNGTPIAYTEAAADGW